jgi:hypothetical protein
MSRTDDDAAARARLERIAWGAASTPDDAARARIALADLDREARTPSRTSAAPAPSSRRGRATPSGAGVPAQAAVPAERAVPAGPAAPGSRSEPDRDVDHDLDGADPTPEAGDDDGRGTRLPAGTPRHVGRLLQLAGRVRRTDRAVLWTFGGAAVVIGLVAGTGVGISVGARTAEPAEAAVTPAAGTVTVEQMLDLPQTFADQLPGSVEAPVALRTTRLVFTNRSLSGDDSATPWNVWAGVGRDRSMICLVATADRIEGTSACYPRAEALHGTVSLSATSRSGTLWVRLVGGAVRGTVTSSASSPLS